MVARSRALALLTAAALSLPAALVTPQAWAAGRPADPDLDVVSFNVLAPIWAGSQWYPADLDPALLDADYRRERVTAFLRQQAGTAEIVALQEVQESEYPHLAAALGRGYVGFMARNDPQFWSQWLSDGVPWQPNGTALFLRRSAFDAVVFAELDLSTGNSIAWASMRHVATGRSMRAASVHLDSDSQVNRMTELAALVSAWAAGGETTDVVAGDINEDTVNGSLAHVFEQNGFLNVLAAVGNREQTHPWLDTFYMSAKWGILDHIVVRRASAVSGDVIDSGVWAVEEETARIAANFTAIGSDHFPVVATARPALRTL